MIPNVIIFITHGKTEKVFLENFMPIYLASWHYELFGKDTSSERLNEDPNQFYGINHRGEPYFCVNMYEENFEEMLSHGNLSQRIQAIWEGKEKPLEIFFVLLSDINEKGESKSRLSDLMSGTYKEKTEKIIKEKFKDFKFNIVDQLFVWSKEKFEKNFKDFGPVTKKESKKHQKPREYIEKKRLSLDIDDRQKVDILRNKIFEQLDESNTNLIEFINLLDDWFRSIGE